MSDSQTNDSSYTFFFKWVCQKDSWNGLILAGFDSMSQIMDFTTDSYSLTKPQVFF